MKLHINVVLTIVALVFLARLTERADRSTKGGDSQIVGQVQKVQRDPGHGVQVKTRALPNSTTLGEQSSVKLNSKLKVTLKTMPPKKKGKGKKGKKKGKKKNDAELTIDDKYKKTLHEIEALQDHLASRKEIARRSQAHSEEWKLKMETAHDDLVTQKDDQKAISTDMTRQYKHMQTELNAEIHRLAAQLDKMRAKLDHTENRLEETTLAKERITKEKDALIAELQDKIKNMEFSYESMMQEALDNMVSKLSDAQKRWQQRATSIHFESKQKLMEFGLNPLDI